MHVQLLWRIDQGEAVQISGIPDPWLRDKLQQLFGNLSLASSSKVCTASRLRHADIPDILTFPDEETRLAISY